MSNNLMLNRDPQTAQQGFSLIELLVVIAVIAILAAIIFPVFFTAKEKSRQATVISNYSKINAAVARYELDHRNQAPDILFAYPDSTKAALQADGFVLSEPPGLYPSYESDASVFQDPNNTVTDRTATASVFVNGLTSDGALIKSASKVALYTFDGLDLSPMMTGASAVDTTRLVPRYQRAWTSLTKDPGDPLPGGLTPDVYQRQMAIQSAPGGAYVTCTTYHVKAANKVLVLFHSGSAKTVDAAQFFGAPAETTDDIGVTAGGVSAANFWKYTPNGY